MKRWQIWLVSGLLIVGTALLMVEPLQNYLITSYHPTITRQLITKNQTKVSYNSYDMARVKDVNAQQVIAARLHAHQINIIGQLLVPTANLHLPIASGVDNTTLMLAAGTMRPNQQMGRGNYPLAGHHMLNRQALFSPLYYKAQIGTNVFITDLKVVYQYQIKVRKMIMTSDIKVIDNTKMAQITLITCNDSGDKRLLLQGPLINKMAMKQAPPKILQKLAEATNNHDVLRGY